MSPRIRGGLVLVLLGAAIGCDAKAEPSIAAVETPAADHSQSQDEREKALDAREKQLEAAQNEQARAAEAAKQAVPPVAPTAAAPVAEPVAVAPVAVAAAPTEPSAPVEPAAVKHTAPKHHSGRVGVRECDEFINRHLRCAEQKLPKDKAATIKSAMATAAKKLKALADFATTAEERASLVRECNEGIKKAREFEVRLGCDWG